MQTNKPFAGTLGDKMSLHDVAPRLHPTTFTALRRLNFHTLKLRMSKLSSAFLGKQISEGRRLKRQKLADLLT